MKAVAFTPAAQSDLDEIWDYSATTWGAEQADRYIDAIRDACIALAAGKRHGRPVEVRADYLQCSTGSHRIYFRDCGDRLEVVRVLHGRQDMERHL